MSDRETKPQDKRRGTKRTIDHAAIAAAYRERKQPRRELAQRFDCCIDTVDKALKRAGIRVRKQWTEEDRFDFAERWNRGDELIEIARCFDISKGAALRKADEFGLESRLSAPKWNPSPVSLAAIEEKVIRPGIEEHLTPLLHFQGSADLGRIHRLWNLSLLMMEANCPSTYLGADIALDPEFAHLCGPHKRPDGRGLIGFFSRLLLKPNVANLIPGLLDYTRSIIKHPLLLTPVSELRSRQNRGAWWRTWEEGSKRAPSERIIRPRVTQLVYPFLVHDPGKPDEGFNLTMEINNAVPKGLPPDLRADICQDLCVAILSGDLDRSALKNELRGYIGRVQKMFPTKYGPLSLDAMIGDTDRTLGEMISDEAEHF